MSCDYRKSTLNHPNPPPLTSIQPFLEKIFFLWPLKHLGRIVPWNLELLWCLDVGVWSFINAWCLGVLVVQMGGIKSKSNRSGQNQTVFS